MTTNISAYPALPALKGLYPAIGFQVLSEADGVVKALQTINGKTLRSVVFSGETADEVEGNILRLWHWEKTHKKLPLPFDITKTPRTAEVEVPAPAPAPVEQPQPSQPVIAITAPPTVVSVGGGLAANAGSTWVNNGTINRRVTQVEADALVAAGWKRKRLFKR